MPDDDAEKLATGGKVPGGGADLGTRGRVSDEDLGETPEGVPGEDETATVPTRGRVPGTGTGLATAGRVGEEETYVAVSEMPSIPVSHPRIKKAEDIDKWKFKLFDVRLRRPGKDEISLLDQGLLMRVGDITKEFEQDYGQFAVSSVVINVSNLKGFLDTGNPGGYFFKLSKDEIVKARVILKDTDESVFSGILSQKEEDFDIDTDEGVLELEGLLKEYENVSAEMMWQDDDPDDPHRFKSISAVVEKCRGLMNIDLGQTVIEKPTLTLDPEGSDYSFSYYNRVNKDEVVNSIAVDENGIVYQCTDHKIYSFNPETEETKELYSIPTHVSLCNLLYCNSSLYFIEDDWQINPGFHWIIKLEILSLIKTFIKNFKFYDRTDFISPMSEKYWEWYEVPGSKSPSTGLFQYERRFYQAIGLILSNIGFYANHDPAALQGNINEELNLNHIGFRYIDFFYPEITQETDSDYLLYASTEHPVCAGQLVYLKDMTYFDISETDPDVISLPVLPTYIMLNFGLLPLYLQPGKYSFFSLPDSNYSLPKRFKVFYKHDQRHSMVIVNGILFFTYSESDFNIKVGEINLSDTSQFQEVNGLFSKDSYLSLNSHQHILTATLNEGSVNEINTWVMAYQINGYNNKNQVVNIKFSNREKSSPDALCSLSKNLVLWQTPDIPQYEYTGFRTGIYYSLREWRGKDNNKYSRPPDPPFHLNYLNMITSYWTTTGNHYVVGILQIFLQGDQTEKFKAGDFIIISSELNDPCLNRQTFYIREVRHETEQNKGGIVYRFDRTVLVCELSMKPSDVPINGYIYLQKGKRAKESIVADLNNVLSKSNYSFIEKEDREVPDFQVKEKAEPIKLQNKDIVITANFKVFYEDGTILQSVPIFPSASGTYQIKLRQGTDFNEAWIYFSQGDIGKTILINYDYIDEEKKFQALTSCKNKLFFVESKTNRLISYDGTQFKEEGLTYDQVQPDYSVRILTEQIKSNETGISSNLVYDSLKDRIYGVTSPNDCVLFQYAKNIALYIPDCKFLGKNVLQVLGECARICNFVVYMDDEGKLYFVPRDYNVRNFILTEEDIFSINSRMAAYEFGETYEKISVRFDGGEVVLGEGMLSYSSGSDYVSSRGWATVLTTDLQDYFSTNPQIFTIIQKFITGIRPLDMVLPIVTEKYISSMAIVQRIRIDQENQKVEITAR